MIKECKTCGAEGWCHRKKKLKRYIFEKTNCKNWVPKFSDEWIKERMELEQSRAEQFGRAN